MNITIKDPPRLRSRKDPHGDLKSLDTKQLFMDAAKYLGQDLRLHWRDLVTLRDRISREGYPFWTKTLPSLGKALDRAFASGRFQCPNSFKRRKSSSALPAFLGSLFAKCFYDTGLIRDDACPEAIKAIRQVCYMTYKAILPYNEVEESKVIDNFIRTEEEISRLVIKSDLILQVANGVISQIFADFDPNKLIPKHGPGVTSNVSITQKWEHKLNPLPVTSHFGGYFFFNASDGMDRLERYPVRTHHDLYTDLRNKAKVILVPKDSRGPRLISCEPAENQFIQQGILRYMVDKLESHPLTAGHVNFTDQTINGRLAKEASITKEYSTLDLKDASDRVSLQLVDKLFEGQTLLESLHQVRSSKTELPDGRVISLSKHAPMGSAVCFPVLAVSIWSLIFSWIFGLTGDLEEAKASVYVYGDDIIVKTKYAQGSISLLERYGLLVNKDKSFIGSPFAESCGVDAFKGENVTPIRLRKCETSEDLISQAPETLESLVAFANNLSLRGYRLTSEYFWRYTERWLGPLPLGHSDSPYLCRLASKDMLSFIPESNYLNGLLKWYPRKNIQRFPLGALMKAYALDSVKESDVASGWGHLYRIHNQLGKEESLLPRFGEFSLPKRSRLVRKLFDIYDMSPPTV